MTNSLTLMLLILPIFLIADKPFNKWGERFFTRAGEDLIIVEHETTLMKGNTTYSIYFPTELSVDVVNALLYDDRILYVDYSFFKLTIILDDVKRVKKQLKALASSIWNNSDSNSLDRRLKVESWRKEL